MESLPFRKKTKGKARLALCLSVLTTPQYKTSSDAVFPKKKPIPLVFTSWRRDIDCVNAGMDIIALTSLNEGTPVSLIEAQAANKPIVSTRVGGIGDIVLENETALLSDVADEKTFCTNLFQIVENSDLRERLGKRGYEHVTTAFSYKRLVNDVRKLYEKSLAEAQSNNLKT